MRLYSIVRWMLFLLEPERAHGLTLSLMDVLHSSGLLRLFLGRPVYKPVRVMGIDFPNPVGLAAGLDKSGDHINALCACGFGFVEIGTVTPVAQDGNPKPRMFRLVKDKAIINRMGFNNKGVDYLVAQVRTRHKRCVLGINIGKNKDIPLNKAVNDYLYGLRHVYPHADYVTVNISSPNTPGLRDLQHGEELEKLLKALKSEQAVLESQFGRYVPVAVKISPDLTDEELRQLAQTFNRYKVDGVIATNTTNDRTGLTSKKYVSEQGGLSGQPLTKRSDHAIEVLSRELSGDIPIIAVGGIMSGDDAKRKIEAGASLVQVYTGFVYVGPSLIKECIRRIT